MCAQTDTSPCKTHPGCVRHISQGGLGYPVKPVCVPLSYSGNPEPRWRTSQGRNWVGAAEQGAPGIFAEYIMCLYGEFGCPKRSQLEALIKLGGECSTVHLSIHAVCVCVCVCVCGILP